MIPKVPGQAMTITLIGQEHWLDVAVLAGPGLAPRPQRVTGGIARARAGLENPLRPTLPAARRARQTTTRTERGSR